MSKKIARRGGRPMKAGLATPFGRLVHRLKLDGETVAKELGITRQYVSMLCSGKTTPSDDLTEVIALWAIKKGSRCHASSWAPFKKVRRHVGRPRIGERAV